jgi:UDP-3-O-[3-hydroxymyristoyl] N-acetylglucosamine deacetylase/3-hydroxyacyl-[acyl-carrier-protein] dehydratase
MNANKLTGQWTWKGVGLHTGKEVEIRIFPGEPDSGIRFKRTDLENQPVIPADCSAVSTTNRSTTLSSGNASVTTVEHLLSALYAMKIQDAIIEVDGPEIPILDGSAKPFIEGLKNANPESFSTSKDALIIHEGFEFKDEDTGSMYYVMPSETFEVSVMVDFENPFFIPQYATYHENMDYETEIAGCKTFVFVSELEKLFEAGLIRGGDITNAIVIQDKVMTQVEIDALASKLQKHSISSGHQGVLNAEDLQFPNEPARHKILDLIGDIALCGRRIKGKIVAIKPGHTSNVKLAAVLKSKYLEQKKTKGRPAYNPDQEPVMNVEDIKKLLPHRYPFLLVDKVIELNDRYIVGVKNVTFNESFFLGHFPGNPVFPGVLQMEALAQTGGILALSLSDDGDGAQWDTYFLKMDQVKFKAKVVPGDTMLLKMELVEPIRRGIVRMMGTIYVGNKLVSEGELTAQIVKRQS